MFVLCNICIVFVFFFFWFFFLVFFLSFPLRYFEEKILVTRFKETLLSLSSPAKKLDAGVIHT